VRAGGGTTVWICYKDSDRTIRWQERKEYCYSVVEVK
jgi:hypothetical protein